MTRKWKNKRGREFITMKVDVAVPVDLIEFVRRERARLGHNDLRGAIDLIREKIRINASILGDQAAVFEADGSFSLSDAEGISDHLEAGDYWFDILDGRAYAVGEDGEILDVEKEP